jgi:dihydrodipicolinate synthase/N-acetylneuraminate lyase
MTANEKKKKLNNGGIIPAIVTPKDSNGKVDLKQIKPIIDFLFSKGVDGLHVNGTTGEFASLRVEERKAILEECISATDGRGIIINQVGAVATRDVTALAEHSAMVGADAVSSVPPYYYPTTDAMILNHYRRISEASGLPVVIYDNPTTTGTTITPDIARILSDEDTVHGIKVARGDMYATARFATLNNSGFVIYPVETFYLSGLVMSDYAGTIGSMSNWIPEIFTGIKLNFLSGNIKRAAALQRLVCEIINAYTGDEIPCTKALVEYRGLRCGDTWEPMLPLNSDDKRKLYKSIESFILNFDELAEIIDN